MQLRVGDQILLKRTASKGKNEIQDCWEDTVYHVEVQPYSGLPVFRIARVTGGGTLRAVHQSLLLPFGGNIEGDPKPAGEGDAIHVQHIQIREKLIYWTKKSYGAG